MLILPFKNSPTVAPLPLITLKLKTSEQGLPIGPWINNVLVLQYMKEEEGRYHHFNSQMFMQKPGQAIPENTKGLRNKNGFFTELKLSWSILTSSLYILPPRTTRVGSCVMKPQLNCCHFVLKQFSELNGGH
jgi:hypothetical protein